MELFIQSECVETVGNRLDCDVSEWQIRKVFKGLTSGHIQILKEKGQHLSFNPLGTFVIEIPENKKPEEINEMLNRIDPIIQYSELNSWVTAY
jgi:hypothetical protein